MSVIGDGLGERWLNHPSNQGKMASFSREIHPNCPNKAGGILRVPANTRCDPLGISPGLPLPG